MSGGDESTCGGYGDYAEFGTNKTLEEQSGAVDSRLLPSENFNDILHKYLSLELVNSNADIFNFVHLGQSMRISNIKNISKLQNTVLKSKAVNKQFEIDLALACIDVDDCETSPNCFQVEDKKKQHMPNDTITSQSTILEDSNFKNQFFVTRSSFEIIYAHLMKEYESTANKRSELNVEKQLLVTLTYLGTVQSYKDIGSKFNIAISTAHKCVNDVTNTLCKHKAKLIYWPTNDHAHFEVQAFDKVPGNRFPGVLGVIGTVELKKSCTANPSKHTKDGSSIVIQCVCNNRYQFYDVFTSYLSKSSATTTTFLESSLAEMMLNNPATLFPCIKTHIVGPCCYPLLPNLMTPYPEDTFLTESQQNYNKAIKILLNIIKLAFGKLLGRFKRLMCLDFWGQEKFAILIFAACCLHNLCMGNGDDIHCKPYECCTFKCDYHDEFSIQKREDLCDDITYKLKG